jgi:hypothetical protein
MRHMRTTYHGRVIIFQSSDISFHTFFIMLSLLSVEIVSDEEYGAIESSLQIADSLVKSRSAEIGQHASVNQSNPPFQVFPSKNEVFPSKNDSLTHDMGLVHRCSTSTHVLDADLAGKSEARSRSTARKAEAIDDVDIEDLAGPISFPASFNCAEPTPLDLWGRPAVFVTTLCMQEWCEMQLDFSLRYLIGFQSGTFNSCLLV